jgi:hypothetical protein
MALSASTDSENEASSMSMDEWISFFRLLAFFLTSRGRYWPTIELVSFSDSSFYWSIQPIWTFSTGLVASTASENE